MTKGEALSLELELESKTTRKLLEGVPEDAFDWKPHEKSMTLGQLASHLAENPNWVTPKFPAWISGAPESNTLLTVWRINF